MDGRSNSRWISRKFLGIPFIHAATIAVSIFGGAAFNIVFAQSGGLSEVLAARVNQYITSWNTHDAIVLAGHFTTDADMIMGNGPILGNREAIINWWQNYFAVQEPERKLSIEILSTRAITADVAIVNVRTTTGGETAQGIALHTRKARGTWVLVRRNGEWLIASMRGMPTQQDRIIRDGG